MPLAEKDVSLVRQAGDRTPIGAYYHWYLQKLLVARAICKLDRERALALVQVMDHTNYTAAQPVIDSPTGVIIAIPHHAHYILSMTALAERLGQHRPVNVFYGQPATHKGNEVFDRLHQVLFSSLASGVNVIHDNRQGLAKAINGLKNGEIVIIMPDAFQDEDATMMVPFLGRLMNTMLGTAILARKTGSWILPVVSKLHRNRLAFMTHFGTRLDYPANGSGLPARQTRIHDYAVTHDVFQQFEAAMRDEPHLWQHVRRHFANSAMRLVDTEALPGILDAMENAPPFRAPDLALDLT
jgi:lauroyl/myristoyl acyltransferase